MLVLLLAPAISSAQGTSNITGVITLSDGGQLPANAIVTMQLADVTVSGAPAVVITEQAFGTGGAQTPFAFTLPYNPEQINPTHRYSVQGNIRVSGQVRYTTTTPYLVLTAPASGITANVQIVMRPASSGGLPAGSGGGVPLLIVAALLAAGLAVTLVRRSLRTAA